MLQLCVPPALTPTLFVRDIVNNSLTRQHAYDDCAARMRCLVGWFRAASAGKSAPDCERNASLAPLALP